jgi:ferredoxin
MDEYTECDQCNKRCPVDALRCGRGRARYTELTGKEYTPTKPIEEDDGEAYRRMIRERRARRMKKAQVGQQADNADLVVRDETEAASSQGDSA